MIGVMPHHRKVAFDVSGGRTVARARRAGVASLCVPPSGSPSVTSSRDGACLSTAPIVSNHQVNHQRHQRVSPTTALERRRGRASPSCTGIAARACPRPSLGGRGRRDESVVTGVPRKPGTGYAVRVYARFLACERRRERHQNVSPTTALERRCGRAQQSCTGLAARARPRLLSGWARAA